MGARRPLAAIAAGIVCLGVAASALGLDTKWPNDQDAATHHLKNLPAPAGGTEALRLTDVAIGACTLGATGVNGSIVCAGSLSGVTTFVPPLSLSGSTLSLLMDGTSVGLVAGSLSRLALTGAITASQASGVTAFGVQTGGSLFGVAGSSSAVPAPIVATTANTVPLFNGTVVGWSAIPPGATLGIIANWPLTTVRTFCLDAVNGNDANPGFSDGAGPYTPATLCKASEAGLASILPTTIAGRKGRILYNPASMPVTWLGDLLSGFSGYSTWVIRPTATNSTAGAIAFADDANDRVFSGFTTATNANVGGYNPTGTPTTTTLQLLKAGGGSPSFSAEPASPLGYRVRFDSGTATTALRNAIATIIRISGLDTVVLDVALPATPTAADLLYIEMPGAVFSSTTVIGGLGSGSGRLQIVGSRFTSSLSVVGPGSVALIGSGAQILAATSTDGLTATPSFTDPTGGTTVIGGSIRVEGATTLTNPVGSPSFSAAAFAGTFTLNGKAAALTFSNGSVFGAGLVLNRGTGLSSRLFSVAGPQCRVIGPTVNGGIVIFGADVILGNVDITMPSQNGVVIGNTGVSSSTVIVESSLTGTEAGGFRGLVLTGTAGSKVILLSQPTLTGGSGDIALGDGTTVSWANAIAKGIIDNNGNQIMPSSGPWPITVTPAGGTVLSGGTLTVPNLVGPGHVQATSGGLLSVDASVYLLDPTCNGIAVRTASGVTTCRSITSTGGTVTITNPTGVAGNINLEAVGAAPTGAAGGALTGTYPNPGVNVGAGASVTGLLPLGNQAAPTGTGFVHDTSGAWDGAARAIDLSSADVTSQLKAASFPVLTGPVTTPGASLATSLNLGAGGVTGTLPAASFPVLSGAVTTTVGSTVTAFGAGAAIGVLANATNASAVPSFVSATAGHQVFKSNAGGTALTWAQLDYSELTGTPSQAVTLAGDVSGSGATGSTITTTLNNIPNDTPLAGAVLATSMVAPGTPATGKLHCYGDGAAKDWSCKNDIGTVTHTAQSQSSTSGVALTGLSDAGVWTTQSFQAPVAWPGATQVLVSQGSAGGPIGDSSFTYDTTNHKLTLAASDGLAVSLRLTMAGDQIIQKEGTGSLQIGTLGNQALQLYTNNGAARLIVTGAGDVDIPALSAGGIVNSAASSGKLGLATSANIASAMGVPTGALFFWNGSTFQSVSIPSGTGLDFTAGVLGGDQFIGAGSPAAQGMVPNPGATPGLHRSLMDDATWQDARTETINYTFSSQNTTSICSGWLLQHGPVGAAYMSQYNCVTEPLSSVAFEFPVAGLVVKTARVQAKITSLTMSGTYSCRLVVTQDGTGPSSVVQTPPITSTGVWDSGDISLTGGATTDSFGLFLSCSGSGTANDLVGTATVQLKGY